MGRLVVDGPAPAPARPQGGAVGTRRPLDRCLPAYDFGPLPETVDPDHLLAPFLLTPEQVTGAARSAAQTAQLDGGTLTPGHVRQEPAPRTRPASTAWPAASNPR